MTAPNSDPNRSALIDQLFQQRPNRWMLDNGMSVVHAENNTNPLVSLQVWVRTGSIHEGRHLGSGLSHYLEHMLFKGTPSRPGNQLTEDIQALGGYVNAYTAFDRTVYHLDLPAEAANKGLELLADLVFNASVLAEDADREKGVILREIDMANDDPDRELTRSLLRTAFTLHPYRYPVIGHRELFEATTREDLWQYYRSRYVPENMVLVVTGKVSEKSVRTAVDKHFAKVPRSLLHQVTVPQEPEQLAYRYQRIRGAYQICRGGLGFRIPSLRHPDAPAIDILAAVLGAGYSSFLRREIREERKLVHHIEATAWNPGASGLFWISYACEPGLQDEVEATILERLDFLAKTGIPEGPLNKARRFALAGEIHSRQSVSGMAGRIGLAEAIIREPSYPRRYLERLSAAKADELTDLMRRYLTRDQLTSVSLEPEKSAAAKARSRRRPKAALPSFRLVEMANGARILLQPDRDLPRIHMRYAGLGGPLYETSENRGVTHLMATLLTSDTLKRSAREVVETLETEGGIFSESVGNNTFALALEMFPEQADLGLELLQQGLTEPAFREATIDWERRAQLSLLHESLDDIVEFGRKSLRFNFFGEHPFGADPLGEPLTVEELNRDRLLAHHRQLICPANAVMAVTGDFDPDQLLPKLEGLMDSLPQHSFNKIRVPFETPAQIGSLIDHMPREQCVVFQAYHDDGICADDTLMGDFVTTWLSDMSGPLFQNIRERQSLAYFASAARLLAADYGMLYLFAGTQPGKEDRVFSGFDEVVQQLCADGVPRSKFTQIQRRLKVTRRMQLQHAGARGTVASLNALYNKPIEDWLTLDERIDALTPEAIADYARKRFNPEQCLRLTVSPANE